MTEMNMEHHQANSEFQVVGSRVKRYITHYDCCAEPYPDIKVSVTGYDGRYLSLGIMRGASYQ